MDSYGSIVATVRQLQRRSAATGILAISAAWIFLAAAFLPRFSDSLWIAVALGVSLLTSIGSIILQRSKARVERQKIISTVTSVTPINIAPEAVRAIGSLETGDQINALAFLQRLSTDPPTEMATAEHASNRQGIFQTRLGENYRIFWKSGGRTGQEITVLTLTGWPQQNLAVESDADVSR
jgi:hypothetical protein